MVRTDIASIIHHQHHFNSAAIAACMTEIASATVVAAVTAAVTATTVAATTAHTTPPTALHDK